MGNTAFQTQFRDEFIAGFGVYQSLVRECTTTEAMVKGNTATFLVVDTNGATASTRGPDGMIPARSNNYTQNSATLAEWNDLVRMTNFNIFASQGDHNAIMQKMTMKVLNNKIDSEIITALSGATVTTTSYAKASVSMVNKSLATLGKAGVPRDGNIFALVSDAFLSNLQLAPEFSRATYVTKKTFDGDNPGFTDTPGWWEWNNVKWLVHPSLDVSGNETCYMFHRSAIGHALDQRGIDLALGYDEEQNYTYCRATGYMGAKLLQNSGVVKMLHDGTGDYAS